MDIPLECGGLRFPGAFGAVTSQGLRRAPCPSPAMATIGTGAGQRGTRQTNHELPLVPFIDFLICLVVFLLAQAGFANIARLQSNANVPGKASELPVAPL